MQLVLISKYPSLIEKLLFFFFISIVTKEKLTFSTYKAKPQPHQVNLQMLSSYGTTWLVLKWSSEIAPSPLLWGRRWGSCKFSFLNSSWGWRVFVKAAHGFGVQQNCRSSGLLIICFWCWVSVGCLMNRLLLQRCWIHTIALGLLCWQSQRADCGYFWGSQFVWQSHPLFAYIPEFCLYSSAFDSFLLQAVSVLVTIRPLQ